MRWPNLVCLVLAGVSAVVPVNIAVAADVGSNVSLQAARERVAQNLEPQIGGLAPVPIALQPFKVSVPERKETPGNEWFGWWQPKRPAPQKDQQIDVLAPLKSGEQVLITRISGSDPAEIPLVLDSVGRTVAFFRSSNSKVNGWNFARSAFTIFFKAERGLVERSGEVTCDIIEGKEAPVVQILNARWDDALHELLFDVRSNCGVVKFLGGTTGDALLNLTGLDFKTALEVKTPNESSRRLVVSFDDKGEFEAAAMLSTAGRSMRTCSAEAKKAQTFQVCGPDDDQAWVAYWKSDGQEREEWMLGCGADADQERNSGPGYFVGACTTTNAKEATASISLSLAHHEAPRSIDIEIACKCGTLRARRLEYDQIRREISFNLETDASSVTLDKQEVQLPKTNATEQDGRSRIAVPVFSIRLNDRWQVIEMLTGAQQPQMPTAAQVENRPPQVFPPAN